MFEIVAVVMMFNASGFVSEEMTVKHPPFDTYNECIARIAHTPIPVEENRAVWFDCVYTGPEA